MGEKSIGMDRRQRLERDRSALMRGALAVKDRFESFIAGRSVHGDPGIYDPRQFEWTRGFEAKWRTIRAELDAVMTRRDQMPSFQEILAPVGAINQDDQWKTFWLAGMGMDCRENVARCPETSRLLLTIPGMKTAFFSILAPGKHIPAHRGAYNGILRYHLGLIVPEPRERCRIRIGDRYHAWAEGESLIFDDSFNHEVWNDTDGYRVVLFVDFTRPLKGAWHNFNEGILRAGSVAPFLRQANRSQKRWAQRFYKS